MNQHSTNTTILSSTNTYKYVCSLCLFCFGHVSSRLRAKSVLPFGSDCYLLSLWVGERVVEGMKVSPDSGDE